MNKIIGICGNRRVGKDTFYNLFQTLDKNVCRYAFADELKNDLADLFWEKFNVDIHTMDGELKEKLRPILIAYGLAWRNIDPLHWVKIVNTKIVNDDCTKSGLARFETTYCIPDFRFANEIEFFKNRYGKRFILVGIDRIGAPEPTEEEQKHWPELKKYFDHYINWPTVDSNLNELMPYIKDIHNCYE